MRETNISRRSFLNAAAGAAAFTLLPSHVLGGVAKAASTSGKLGVLIAFNRPRRGGQDGNLANFLLDAFDSAAKDSKVWGSMFHWSSRSFTDRLNDIRKLWHLELHIYGGNADDDVPDKVKEFFDKKGVYGKIYKDDPDGMMNHNKWFLFEQLDWGKLVGRRPAEATAPLSGVGPALYVSSANLTDDAKVGNWTDEEKHNNAVIVPVNAPVVEAFKDYYKKIKKGYQNMDFWSGLGRLFGAPEKKNHYRRVDTDRARFYIYPRRPCPPSKDTVLQVLNNVHVSPADPCEIRIVTPRWRGDRKVVADRLAELKAQGAIVEVVCRWPDKNGDDGEYELSQDIEKVLAGCATRYYQASGVNIHSKYLLIAAPYIQSDGRYKFERLVWTGTPNLTPSALDGHWETLVKLYECCGAYERYLEDFCYLCANATCPPLLPGQR